MIFKELEIGDTFDVDGTRYIKITLVIHSFNPDNSIINVRNSVCIDEYSDRRGELKNFHKSQTVSRVNWS